ncbi:MAG: glycosyltransferase family 2 protein, partial [Anaerolineales bacterium]
DPKTFDLIYFSKNGWDSLSDEIRQRAEHFARDGVRVLIISQDVTPGALPSLKTVAEGIFSLFLPDIWSDQYIDWFDILRQDMHIYEAMCWVENPDWASLAYRLRNRYGWKIVSTEQPIRPVSLADTISLHSRSDLQLDARFEELQYSDIRSTLDNQYPKASILILTYNNIGYTRQCLESISAKTAYPNYEVVVVDNASTDGTVEFLQEYAAGHTGIRLVINQENRGFAAGNNQGIAASTGEYIVFLNNDTIVTLGWLSGLISHLRDPAVGAVGPVTNSAGNESKIGVDYSEISDLDDFARRHAQAHNGESFEIRMLALFCMLVRRSVIEQVGVLDERFGVGMYEDDDFSLRIRQKGYRLLCAEDVYIHHWGSASFSQIDAERIQRLHIENRAKFEAKWGTEWQPHRWRMDEA